jgi:hypothetical protein
MAFDVNTVADAVDALSVSGVTIKKQSNTPDAITARDCPIVYPAGDFVTGLNYTLMSAGTSSPCYEITFALNYFFAVAPVGAGRGLFEFAETIQSKASLFCDAVADAPTALGVDYAIPAMSQALVVEDAAGNQFFGCTLTINCRHFDNK